jgi:hypothetical protein
MGECRFINLIFPRKYFKCDIAQKTPSHLYIYITNTYEMKWICPYSRRKNIWEIGDVAPIISMLGAR